MSRWPPHSTNCSGMDPPFPATITFPKKCRSEKRQPGGYRWVQQRSKSMCLILWGQRSRRIFYFIFISASPLPSSLPLYRPRTLRGEICCFPPPVCLMAYHSPTFGLFLTPSLVPIKLGGTILLRVPAPWWRSRATHAQAWTTNFIAWLALEEIENIQLTWFLN